MDSVDLYEEMPIVEIMIFRGRDGFFRARSQWGEKHAYSGGYRYPDFAAREACAIAMKDIERSAINGTEATESREQRGQEDGVFVPCDG